MFLLVIIKWEFQNRVEFIESRDTAKALYAVLVADTCHSPITNNGLQFLYLVVLLQHFQIIAQFVFGWIDAIVADGAHFALPFLFRSNHKKMIKLLESIYTACTWMSQMCGSNNSQGDISLRCVRLTYIAWQLSLDVLSFRSKLLCERWTSENSFVIFRSPHFWFRKNWILLIHDSAFSVCGVRSHSFVPNQLMNVELRNVHWTHPSFKRDCIVFLSSALRLNENKACAHMHRQQQIHTRVHTAQRAHSLS